MPSPGKAPAGTIDFQQLRAQKQALVELTHDGLADANTVVAARGLVEFLDWAMDCLADQFGEHAVFCRYPASGAEYEQVLRR